MSFNPSFRIAAILACLVFFAFEAHTQIAFEQLLLPEPAPQLDAKLRGMSDGDAVFADLNADGFEDLIITGITNYSFQLKTEIYWNDGIGNFARDENLGDLNFAGGFGASVVTGDFDGDGTIDILVASSVRQVFGSPSVRRTELFSNNGSGQFTLLDDSTFVGLQDGGVAVADIDNDGDIDILLYGRTPSFPFEAKTVLYRNLGDGVFAEALNTGIVDSRWSNAAFADVDGDGDNDFVLSGANTAGVPHTYIYLNDGTGTFAQQAPGPIAQVRSGSVLLTDFNGDGLPELVLLGSNSNNQNITHLYSNTGNGNFVLNPSNFLNFGGDSDIAAEDIDGDGDLDLVMTASSSRIYLNNGNSQFSLAPQQPLISYVFASLAFSDVDGDGDPDLVHKGKIGSVDTYTSLWVNNGGNFALNGQSPFAGVYSGATALVDTDDGGELDILYSGVNTLNLAGGNKHQNLGEGNFGPSGALPFAAVYNGDFAFADVNGNGHLDVLASGSLSNATRSTKLYLNNGSGQYTEAAGTPFKALRFSSVAFGDVDGDGDQDVIICGEENFFGSFRSFTGLYFNDGAGNFIQSSQTFPGLTRADFQFGDLDGDGDLDLVLAGRFTPVSGNVNPITRVYLNNGSGSFTWATGNQLAGMDNGRIALGDVDGDGDLDFAVSGIGFNGGLKLYLNADSADFSDSGLFNDIVLMSSTVDFADFDGDGDLDMFLTGEQEFEKNEFLGSLFENNGSGNFTEVENLPFEGVVDGSVAIGDVNGDGRPDLFYTGRGTLGHKIAHLYLNNSQSSCEVNGGSLSASTVPADLCVGDGVPTWVQVSVTGNQGLSSFGLVRASNNTIAATNTSGNFNMEDYPAGNYLIGHLSYTSPDQLVGITQVNQLQGCFELSNTLPVNTLGLNGGSIAALSPTTVCGNDGEPSILQYSLQGAQGPNTKWVALTGNFSQIVAVANNPNFNFDNFGEGIYRVVHAAYANGVNPGGIDLPTLPPCIDASNFVTVTVVNCPGLPLLETYPNPALSEARVHFVPSVSGEALIEVFDATGRRMSLIFHDEVTPDDDYYFQIQTAHLAPGMYLLRLSQNGEVTTRKILK